ncbi:MAG: endonuclease MutS2 [Candidatus Cloacimonetes bacterium]|nr:endonuclease MutS2 [Candidatus Cloacimonadota bacterium]
MDSYKQLEFDKIKRILANQCHSLTAKRFALSLLPLKKITEIRQRQIVVSEIQEIIKRRHDYDFHNIYDIKPLFYHYEHLTYSYPEFHKIYKVVTTSAEIIGDHTNNKNSFSDTPEYQKIIEQLVLLPEISKKFARTFADDGEVLDTASPALQEIRGRQSRLRQSILGLLQKKIQEKQLENVIQDKIITLRDDRYVIPLKEGSIGSMPGIIHGYSGSRATIFVEPNEAIGMNNEIHQLRQEEKEEIFRILKDFTEMIQEYRDDLLNNYSILGDLDFYFAIARLGNSFKGNTPLVSEKTVIKLENARHPLLLYTMQDEDKVIPFDLELGQDYDILVLSGPNTGGKTVTLKTIGLLTMMALSGLPIPADKESEIGQFSHILADIGDQQSLEDSLSTFSAHLGHIREMLEIGDDKTMILIDEIGAATDPEQGAALAQSIMESLIGKGVTGVVTTHYTPLKLFAMNSERCQNAAMQFDPDKHIPTYRFKIGLPGNSFALEIAEKLGLQEEVLNRAKDLTGKQNVELTDLLTRISSEKKELAQSKFQYDLRLNLLNQKINEYDSKLFQMESDKKNIRQETVKEAREFLANLQRELESEIAKIRQKDNQERKKETQQVIKKVASLNRDLVTEERDLLVEKLSPVTEPQVGETVWIRELEGTGVIVAVEKNGVKVDFNGILLVTDTHNLFYLSKVKKEEGKKKGVNIHTTGQVKTELKVLGLTFDDALPLIEGFLDEGYAAGLNKLRIVHGKGTGALRNKIRSYLQGVPRIKEHYSPAPEAGGDGVTVVVFS